MNLARIRKVSRDRYHLVSDDETYYLGELLGNLRYTAHTAEDLPMVGDWVEYEPYECGMAFIRSIRPRRNILYRQAVGITGEKQYIAANVDVAVIVQGCDQDFNLNRLERYLTLCHTCDIRPVVLFTKIDLLSEAEVEARISRAKERLTRVDIMACSNETGQGMDEFKELLEPGKTYCLLGSSGAGKSSLINTLKNTYKLATRQVSDSSGKGRHTTTARELIALRDGIYIIDNPGIREVGVADSSVGIEDTFQEIAALSAECHYSDCKHIDEPGCSVQRAIESGQLVPEILLNYQRLIRETTHFESSVAEKRKKDKEMGKMIREVLKRKKREK